MGSGSYGNDVRKCVTCRYASGNASQLGCQRVGEYIVACIGGILFAPRVIVCSSSVYRIANIRRESNLGNQQ